MIESTADDGTLEFRYPPEHTAQYGNIKEIPRTTPLSDLVSQAMQWAVEDLAQVMSGLGIPLESVLPTLQTYYVPAVEPGGGSHSDPLAQRTFRDAPVVHENHLVGWKVLVYVVGDDPGTPLVEGMGLGR